MTNNTPIKLTAGGALLTTLAASAIGYNRWIDRTAETQPGATSLRVAAGTAVTLLAALIGVLIARGLRQALTLAAWLALCFAVAGAPMIAGDIQRDTRSTK